MSVESELRSLRLEVTEARSEIDGAVDKITTLVRSLELDDKLRERTEEADEKERDRRHTEVTDALEVLKKQNEVILINLSKTCQANDLGAAIRTYTWEQKQKSDREDKEREREAITKAVKDATGPHALPPPPFPLPGPGQSGALAKADDDSIMPTKAQWKLFGRLVKWAVAHKIQASIVGGILAHWLYERGAALVITIKNALAH